MDDGPAPSPSKWPAFIGRSTPQGATMALAQASLSVGSGAASPFHTQPALLKSASNPSLPLSPKFPFPSVETGTNTYSLGKIEPSDCTQSSKARKSIFGRSPFRNLTLSRKDTEINPGEAGSPHSLSACSSTSDGMLGSEESIGAQFLSEGEHSYV